MIELFARVIDEAWHGFNSSCVEAAAFHVEALRELVDQLEEHVKWEKIPEEMVVA